MSVRRAAGRAHRPSLLAILGVLFSLVAPVSADDTAALRAVLTRLVPSDEVESIKQTDIPSLFEVIVAGRIYYFTESGSHFLQGDLIDVSTRRNVTEDRRRMQRLKSLERVGEESMVVFSPENPEHIVSVFTDVDCPYCVTLHREVPQLMKLGVKVRYLAFPRKGIPSQNYDRMVSVWCAANQQQAMTDAKEQRPLQRQTCDSPVQRHYAVGRSLGITGTPTLILENGEKIGGYIPYQRLMRMLMQE